MDFGGSFNGGMSMDQESLVMEVKNLQRSNEEAKHMWWEYCQLQLGGIRDPSRHDATVLQEFLSAYQAGTLPQPTMTQSGGGGGRGGGGRIGMGGGNNFAWGPGNGGGMGGNGMGGSGNPLADFIKTGQRHSQAWKTIWANYCTTVGTGTFDPNKYDNNFIVSFIDYLANLSLADPVGPPPPGMGSMGGMGMGGMKRPMGGMGGMGMDGGPPKKRMAMGGMGGMDNGPKGQLVDKIKTLQRSGEEMKQAWWNFCDNNLGGVRDPNRHDIETLQAFLSECGM